MNEQRKNNGRGIFYGVIGVATLVVAIIGATFAYFTATASAGENVITGNMSSINFGLTVEKVTTVDETKGGMIPMSNTMVEAASSNASTKGVCTDDNGNAVCQIYKITVRNTGTASLFVDGYVTLTDAEGKISYDPTDAGASATNKTVMRWAQVFQTGTSGSETYTTVGHTTTGATGPASTKGITTDWDSLAVPTASEGSTGVGLNNNNIKTTGVTGTGTIQGSDYEMINTNYIRISDHDPAAITYSRTADVTSALVFNQYLDAAGGTTPSMEYYVVVWLTETGTNQTPASNDAALQFFSGKVTFLSAQGSEVTATFGSYSRVPSTSSSAQQGSGNNG